MGTLVERQGKGANLLMTEFDHEFQAIRVGWDEMAVVVFSRRRLIKFEGRNAVRVHF